MALDPQTVQLNPSALIALHQRRNRFVPVAGTSDKPNYLVVQLPGELMRCPVERVLDEDTVIVRISQPPISRTHSFRFDEPVIVKRRQKNSRDVWEGMTEREYMAERQRMRDAERAANPRPARRKPEPVATAPEPPPPIEAAKPEKAKPKAKPVKKTAKAAPKKKSKA